ncbi:MAG TPA: xanthine dehydrogenase family protein subunit M [Acidimicrobiales bacterium]|nr:xanthine dehydrogenase family protein subunit M [Acidimicrobiales bacterium]
MIPAAFEYVRADSVDAAIAALTEHGDEAKLLAGGHSLLPLMKLRLAFPAVLVDIGRVSELNFVREEGDEIVVGALTRHSELARHDLVRQEAPLLARAASLIGDPQVRHRGTIGGSLAHGDPASDLPAVVLALGATLVAQGPDGRREIGADDMFQGFLETALDEDEMLTEIRLPRAAGRGWSYQKFTRRSQDWAIVAVAALIGDGGAPSVTLVNMGTKPMRARATEAALAAGSTAPEAAALAAQETEPPADLVASPEYRKHLATVLTRRALEEAASR